MNEVRHKLEMAAEKLNIDFYSHKIPCPRITCHHSIVSQIITGRASYEWESALKKAHPEKILLYVNKHGGTVEEDIIATTRYLKRYCGYKVEG